MNHIKEFYTTLAKLLFFLLLNATFPSAIVATTYRRDGWHRVVYDRAQQMRAMVLCAELYACKGIWSDSRIGRELTYIRTYVRTR